MKLQRFALCGALLLGLIHQAAWSAEPTVTGQDLGTRGAPLDAAQTQAWLKPGAEVEHTAPSTGRVRRFTQDADGTLIASSQSAIGKNVTGRGTWEVKANGSYCLTIDWPGRNESNCYQVFSMDGAAYLAPRDVLRNADRRYGLIAVSGATVPAGAGARTDAEPVGTAPPKAE